MALLALFRGEDSEAAEVGAVLVAEFLTCFRGLAQTFGIEVKPNG